jgi:hypothetical protein
MIMKQLCGEHTGIVLKHCIKKRKIALLDNSAGRVDALFFSVHPISIGTVLQYKLQENNSEYQITAQEIIATPILMAQADILFLHHLLELCYYSIPAGALEVRVFEDMLLLYERFSPAWGMPEKIVLLFRMILSLGCYTEHKLLVHLLSQKAIMELYSAPLDNLIDKLFSKTIDLEYIPAMHEWLQICMAGHPYYDQFKTAHFLQNKLEKSISHEHTHEHTIV